MVHLYAAAATTVGQLKAHCPHCGREQVVLPDHRKNPVRCKSCGTLLPAKSEKEKGNFPGKKS